MRKFMIPFIIALLIVCVGAQAQAQISSAAVLFLRIAAGARAAGMGEAYVAIADDATATHWNPAGLGQYPLNSKWFEIGIPENIKPLQAVALLQGEGPADDMSRFDIWAITLDGLKRYNNSFWIDGDIVRPRGDQTLDAVLREYTGLVGTSGDETIPGLINKVAELNSPYPQSYLQSLRDRILDNLDSAYAESEELTGVLDGLVNGYYDMHVDWKKVRDVQELTNKSMRDSLINETEADRLLFLVEKAHWKYLPSMVTVPFEINFEGNLNDIASDDKYLWVATDAGLFRYENGNWRKFGIGEGLPTNNIKRIEVSGKNIALFTDSGLVVYQGGAFRHYGPDMGLPIGEVSAVTFDSKSSAWAVVDNDLYRYNGTIWKNYVDDPDTTNRAADDYYKIMQIYGTDDEYDKFIEKFEGLNGNRKAPVELEDITDDNIDRIADSVGVVTAVEELDKQVKEKLQSGMPSLDDRPATVKVPFTAGLKFEITDIGVDEYKTVWIGTNFGVLNFNGKAWRWLGYKDFTAIDEEITVYDLALGKVNGDSARAERLADIIRIVNNLESDTIHYDETVKVYANPAGSKINDIQVMGSRVYFATSSGTLYFDGIWNRLNEKNLGRRYSSNVIEKDGTLYVLTRDNIAIKASARKEVLLMHVNWLPDLADDIYYEFLGYVQNIEGWGTVGMNVTFLTYGNITRTDPNGNIIGDFSAFDIAVTMSYGSSLTDKLSGGISAKLIYSHLSDIGAGRELGSGTSTGLAIDLGLLYKINPRLAIGMAITNLGPEISYIDVSQSDPLPRNLAIGVAWKVIQSSYNELLFTMEANKSLAERDKSILEDFRDVLSSPITELKSLLLNPLSIGGFSKDFENVIINAGMEYKYGSFIAFRGGYIYDEVGDVKTPTLGVGMSVTGIKFDFAYIPSSDDVPLANTMRFSLTYGW